MKVFSFFLVLVMSLTLVNCSCGCGAEDINLNVDMKFGYKDEVNTFDNFLKKDLVQEGVADTTFSFSAAEKNAILEKANEVGFFDLPEHINSTVDAEVTPAPDKQTLRIKYEDWDHTVTWDMPLGKSANEQKIKELSYFIINLVIDSPEYKALPEPVGGYY